MLLLEACDYERYRVAILLANDCGLRIGELRTLTLADAVAMDFVSLLGLTALRFKRPHLGIYYGYIGALCAWAAAENVLEPIMTTEYQVDVCGGSGGSIHTIGLYEDGDWEAECLQDSEPD